MPRTIRLTYAAALVLQALTRGYRFGFDIMDATGLPSGTVYPALRRMHRAGLVTATWESDETARRNDRPARRNYTLTAAGRARLADARDRYPLLAANWPAAVRDR